MFIQKIFHVHHTLAETKAHLGKVQTFRRHLDGVAKAVVSPEGVGQFDCRVSPHLRLHVVAVELPTEQPGQVLFRSTVGNIALSGLLEMEEVRPSLTEVRLTLEYLPHSWVVRVWELVSRPIERYLERQLRALQGCLDGPLSHSPQAVTAAQLMGLPQFAV